MVLVPEITRNVGRRASEGFLPCERRLTGVPEMVFGRVGNVYLRCVGRSFATQKVCFRRLSGGQVQKRRRLVGSSCYAKIMNWDDLSKSIVKYVFIL